MEIKTIFSKAVEAETKSLWAMLQKSNTDHHSLFRNASSREISEYVSERLINMIIKDFEETKKKVLKWSKKTGQKK